MQKKRILILALCQAAFTCLQVYLVLKISLIGRIGIATIHREYSIFRSGWKTFLLFFGIQAIIMLTLGILQRKSSRKQVIRSASILLGLGVLGLFATYSDFLHTYSHRLLKERFHLGFYLFWLGWIGTCIFFIITTGKKSDALLLQPEATLQAIRDMDVPAN